MSHAGYLVALRSFGISQIGNKGGCQVRLFWWGLHFRSCCSELYGGICGFLVVLVEEHRF